jgi:putative oxidoreductase
MLRLLNSYEPQTYAVVRMVTGLMFACHGLQKAVGAFGGINGAGAAAPQLSLFAIAGWLEIAFGLMIALGIFTSLAAFLASGQMAVAYFIGHYPKEFWPIMNQGVDAVLYCFIFFYIAARGPGIWSVDSFGTATR